MPLLLTVIVQALRGTRQRPRIEWSWASKCLSWRGELVRCSSGHNPEQYRLFCLSCQRPTDW